MACTKIDPEWIDELREFLTEQAGAEYHTDSASPVPNQAMRLLYRLTQLFPEDEQ